MLHSEQDVNVPMLRVANGAQVPQMIVRIGEVRNGERCGRRRQSDPDGAFRCQEDFSERGRTNSFQLFSVMPKRRNFELFVVESRRRNVGEWKSESGRALKSQ